MTNEIEQTIIEKRGQILRLAAQHRASNVRLFGSVARGEAVAGSDIDFVVDFEQGYTLIDRIGLIQGLEDLLGRKVDVVPEKMLHEEVRANVMKDAIPL